VAKGERAERVGPDAVLNDAKDRLDAQKKSFVYAERLRAGQQERGSKSGAARAGQQERGAEFLNAVSQVPQEKRVYVDQCGIDNTLSYLWGWSGKGTRCPGVRLGHKTQRISVMAALGQREMLAPLTFTGSCDAALVEAWMEQHLLPVLLPGQVVILDNAAFHRHAKLRALLATKDCSLLPLPPYSPDLNRIEPQWNALKIKVALDTNTYSSFHEKVDAAFL